MAGQADPNNNLEPDYLIIDWQGLEAGNETQIEKFKVEHGEYSLNEYDSWPLNGKMVRAIVLSMELGFGCNRSAESEVCAPGRHPTGLDRRLGAAGYRRPPVRQGLGRVGCVNRPSTGPM